MKKNTLFALMVMSFFTSLIAVAQGGCDIPTSNLIFTGVTTPLAITQTGSTTSCDPQTVQLCASVPARSSAIYALAAFTSANSIAKYTSNFTAHTLVRDNSYTGPSSGTNHGMDRNPITGEVFLIKESSGRRLFTIDLATNTMVAKGLVLSTTGSNQVVDFTFDNNGIMYAAFNNGTIQKIDYTIPVLTPTAFAVGLPTSAAGLTYDFDANRLLYSSGNATMSLYQINSVGATSLLFSFSFANSGQGIEYVGNNTCYASGTFGDVLYRVNLSTQAATTVLAPTLFSTAIKDLMYVPGVSLQWSDTSGNLGTTTCITVTPTATASYTLTMTNDYGCTKLATHTVTVGPGLITTNGSVTTSSQVAYTWSLPYGTGQTYTTTQTGLTNTIGCNIATLNLTIVPVNTFTVGPSCGFTISNLAVTINTPPVAEAVSYTFRLQNRATLAPAQLIVRPVNSFALSNFAGITLATPYQVEVAVNHGPFGPPCLLYTPTPFSTIGSQCGTTLTSMGQWIYATYVSNGKGYRFRITNTVTSAVQIHDAELNRFNIGQLPNRSFGTVYFVEVALKNTDNTYLPYSSGCTIATPPFPITSISPSQCGLLAATGYNVNLEAVIVSGATEYRFKVSNASQPYIATVDRAVNKVTLSMFPGLLLGTTYSVQVALKVGGIWGPYGPTCNITTPALAKANDNSVATEFKAIAFPNPFAEDFMIQVSATSQSPIQIGVYDMLGRQIENIIVELSKIENLQIGLNYPSGFYKIMVSQGENTKTLRVIKR
jgi:Secretion system C-terminal sorting domain